MTRSPAFDPATATARKGKDEYGDLPEWNLADLYPAMDSPQLTKDLEKAGRDARAFEEKYKGILEGLARSGGDKLAEAIRDYEELDELMGRLGSYAGLVHAADTTDPVRSKFYGDVQEKLTAAGLHLVFFTLELNRIDDELMETALEAIALGHYRPWITDLRREKPYQLEDRVEQLFHEKSMTTYSAWNRLFDETSASLRFTVDGEELGIEQTLALMQHPESAKRKAASEALAVTFKENLRLFTLITNTLAKDKEISDRWRGFKDVAESRHLANRVEPEVVDALVAAVQEAHPNLSHRYYRLKAKWFGKDALDHWDRNAPLPKVPTPNIGWDEARDTVLTAYERFSPEMSAIAKDFFDKNWIDAPVRPGKAPGAFAHPTVPSVHPYVLVNYQGKTRDVMTLAHELGHGVHQVLAGPQGALMSQTPLTLAETASVFGEMLTFRALLDTKKDVTERRAMIAGKVEDMLNTVVRQIAFYSFERKVHTERRQGELTAERLNEIWLEVQHDSLGPAIRLGPGYEVFWTYIPHFLHAPFYVYAYAFGDCLVNSLYAVYQQAESGFQEKYFNLLKAGGTKHHKELLAPFGLDATDPGFWRKGLTLISDLIGELEAMEGK
ncbi:MAG: M3 family oligoendopeptidase [Bauldia sp.]|nr:M3 family oligoendopeptidase [Bauldia sp.]